MTPPLDRSLAPLMCAVGAGALVGQVILIRELMVSFYGTELALASALCCWLLFVTLGSLCGAAVLKMVRRETMLAYLALGAMALGLHAQFLLARLVRPILGAGAGEFLSLRSMLLGALLAASPVAFPTGFLFPVASRLEESRGSLPAAGISRIYVAEAIGSAAAGALLSLYLLGRQTPTEIVFGMSVILLFLVGLRAAGGRGRFCLRVGVLLFALFCLCGAQGRPGVFFASSALVAAAGCVGLWRVRPGQRREVMASAVLVALGVALCVAFLGWGDAVRWGTVRARWRTFSRFRLETVSDTRYQHVELGEREGERVLVQNGYLTAQFPNPRAASAQAALLLTQHPRPRDVLVVGGGLGGLCQELLKGPIAALDYVDADPQLMCLLYDNLPADLQKPLSDPRFAAYSRDGRYFVQRAAKRPGALARAHIPLGRAAAGQVEVRRPVGAYDLVILALGDPASASASRFYTVEFCRELLGILRPGGAVAFCGITSSENYVRGTAVLNYTGCIYKTLRSVFDRVVVRPGDEFCFFASAVEGVVSADTELLVGRFDALGLEPEALKYNLELAEFPPERVLSVSRLLEEARPTALLSSDARPVVFTLFLALQAHFARPEPGGQAGVRDLFGLVRSIRTVWLWLPFLVFLVPVILLRVRFGSERAAPWACGFSIFTSGVFGLSAELLIVYAYQTSFGYVYRDISIIVGLFMLGLALGGWLAGRWWPGRARGSLLVVECMQAVFVLALPMLARGLSFSPFAFMLLAGAAGFLTGSEFPLASRISLLSGREAGTVAGIFDAADHLGALAGAAWAGLLLVPSLGVIQSAALLALVKCVSLVALVLAFVRTRRSARTSVS